MKKNLLSILILALLVVNLIMTGIMMFSVLNQSRKTAELIGKIAQAVDLELSAEEGEEEETAVSMGDTAVYVLSEDLTIPLARGEDDKDHYFIVSVSLSMNMKDKDYKTVLKATLPFCRSAVAVTVENMPRALSASELADAAEEYCPTVTADNYDEAIKKSASLANNDPVFVFGSLYLAGGIRDKLIDFYKKFFPTT